MTMHNPQIKNFNSTFSGHVQAEANVEETTLISKLNIPSPSHTPVVPGQWPNSQVQHIHLPPHLTQACAPFWPAQQPWYLPRANGTASLHSKTPSETTNVAWDGTGTIKRDFPPGYQQLLPCYSYPICSPYPGFPGTYGPSPWWGQPQLCQQPMPPFTNASAGSDGHFALSSDPCCIAASTPSTQRGIIQHREKLLEKHQQRWDAQSAENVRLWNVIGTLKSELAEYKTRLTKIEMNSLSPKPIVKESAGDLSVKPNEKELSVDLSLKPTVKELAGDLSLKPTKKEPAGNLSPKPTEKESADDTRISSHGSGKRKRGRPKKQSASNNFIPSPDQCSGKKPAMLKERQELIYKRYSKLARED